MLSDAFQKFFVSDNKILFRLGDTCERFVANFVFDV